MARKELLSAHLKRLMSGVSDHGSRHLAEVEEDLVQTALLLTEAIEKLSSNFMDIHTLVQSQQELIEMLLAGGKPDEAQVAQLRAMPEEIGKRVNAVVTGMQFQDMTSQLLDRSKKRVTGLREFLDTLGSHGADLPKSADNEDMAELLGRVSMALAIQSLELKSVLRKSVSQQHMECGEIDLF
jgi:hypothetical protein